MALKKNMPYWNKLNMYLIMQIMISHAETEREEKNDKENCGRQMHR